MFNREALEHNCIQLIGNAVKICGWSDSGVDRAHMYRSRIVLNGVGGSALALHLQSDSGLLGREAAAWNNEPLPSYSPLYEQHNNTTTAHSNTTTQQHQHNTNHKKSDTTKLLTGTEQRRMSWSDEPLALPTGLHYTVLHHSLLK